MGQTSKLGTGGVGVVPDRKVFTVEHANRTLPLVRRIVEDLVDVYRQLATTQDRLANEELPTSVRDQLDREADAQEHRFDVLIDELGEVGCELKDANIGLVDFLGRHEGRDIFLCWRLGEDRVEFWHELHTGFGQRQAVSSLNES